MSKAEDIVKQIERELPFPIGMAICNRIAAILEPHLVGEADDICCGRCGVVLAVKVQARCEDCLSECDTMKIVAVETKGSRETPVLLESVSTFRARGNDGRTK